jgi:hypothetical protein
MAALSNATLNERDNMRLFHSSLLFLVLMSLVACKKPAPPPAAPAGETIAPKGPKMPPGRPVVTDAKKEE